ncbi:MULTISPECIES: hypothetical protein [Bacteroidota]|uniref:Uncharacterized protein n=1 Tax=Euzebyella saccharophila TaxID=679664 RepID=A0ABV8JPY7_9FLAO|nr:MULTISPECIES: hypothetical protein [Bacteroidota]
MEQELPVGVKMLNLFLRIMVGCLVLVLAAVPVMLILDKIGLFE